VQRIGGTAIPSTKPAPGSFMLTNDQVEVNPLSSGVVGFRRRFARVCDPGPTEERDSLICRRAFQLDRPQKNTPKRAFFAARSGDPGRSPRH